MLEEGRRGRGRGRGGDLAEEGEEGRTNFCLVAVHPGVGVLWSGSSCSLIWCDRFKATNPLPCDHCCVIEMCVMITSGTNQLGIYLRE